MREHAPIVYVSHDEDDDGWQFHGAQPAQVQFAMVAVLSEVIAIDPTVCEVADIPPGWIAHRKFAGGEWIREKRLS